MDLEIRLRVLLYKLCSDPDSFVKTCTLQVCFIGDEEKPMGRAGSVMVSQIPGSRPGGNGTLSTELPNDYHHNSVRWCVCVCVCVCVCGRSGKDLGVLSLVHRLFVTEKPRGGR